MPCTDAVGLVPANNRRLSPSSNDFGAEDDVSALWLVRPPVGFISGEVAVYVVPDAHDIQQILPARPPAPACQWPDRRTARLSVLLAGRIERREKAKGPKLAATMAQLFALAVATALMKELIPAVVTRPEGARDGGGGVGSGLTAA